MLYLIIMSNGDTHKVEGGVAASISSHKVDDEYTFCAPFGYPSVWLNPDHIVSIVPYEKKS